MYEKVIYDVYVYVNDELLFIKNKYENILQICLLQIENICGTCIEFIQV